MENLLKQEFFNNHNNRQKILYISKFLTMKDHFSLCYLTHLCFKIVKPIKVELAHAMLNEDYKSFVKLYNTRIDLIGYHHLDFFIYSDFNKYSNYNIDKQFFCSLLTKIIYNNTSPQLREKANSIFVKKNCVTHLFTIFLCSWIKFSDQLTHISLIDSNVEIEALKLLSKIKTQKNWVLLCLNKNPVCNKEAIIYLIKIFPFMINLKVLELCYTEMDKITAITFSQDIFSLCNLKEIDLSNNYISESGNCVYLSLAKISTLTSVKLNLCGLKNCSSGLESLKVNCLYLNTLEYSHK
jgi:hypothetical protein